MAGLYMGFHYLKGQDFFSSTHKYYVIYANVGGLEISNPININGVTVGKVSDKQLVQGDINQVVIELDMDEHIILGQGAQAILESDFLGSISITIDNGILTNPIEPLDTIAGVLHKGIEDLLKESALPVANNLEATIKKVNAILDNLSGNGDKINEMMENMRVASKQMKQLMADSRVNLNELSRNYNRLAVTLSETAEATKPVIIKYGELADSLKSVDMNATLSKLNNVMDSVGMLVNNMNNGPGTLTKLLKNDSLYNNLNHTLEAMDKLLIHMNENPKHFFAPLGKSKKYIERQKAKEAKNE
jgi:phospholipid/cholesterol/gamma-HCH transport system substrate-binding protein